MPDAAALRAAAASALVAVLAAFYRFNALGGSLGGFGNDQFIHLARARLLLAGELPFRDFEDPGAPLTSAASALAQGIFGDTLRAEAILSVGALACGAGLTCWLACRLTRRVWPGLVVGLLQVAIAPRLYNYPKIVLMAAGILLAWRYVDRPRPLRLLALSALLAVAFLFRHDYAIYLGVLVVATLLLAHRHERGAGVKRSLAVAGVSLALLLPAALFLQMSGGVVRYLEGSAEFARADTRRTSFRFPSFDLRLSAPLLASAPEPPPAPAHVNVRWAEAVTDDERTALEREYSLTGGEPRDGTTWTYVLADTSAGNIERLVRDARVLDTHGVNRTSFTVATSAPERGWRASLARLRLAPELTSRGNAVAWLYYLLAALPAVAACAWPLRARPRDEAAYLWPVIALQALLVIGFLSRGTTDVRLADVSVPAGILGAWLLAGLARWPARLAGAVVLAVTTWEVGVIGAVPATADRSGFLAGPGEVLARADRLAARLGVSPPAEGLVDDGNTPMARLARWVHRCTAADDRVFVLGNFPELYVLSGRLAAGGHVWFVPGYATSEEAQARTLARIRRHDVPVVMTDAAQHATNYAPEFPLVDRFIAERYTPVGPFGPEAGVQVHVRREGAAAAADAETGLPCLAGERR